MPIIKSILKLKLKLKSIMIQKDSHNIMSVNKRKVQHGVIILDQCMYVHIHTCGQCILYMSISIIGWLKEPGLLS